MHYICSFVTITHNHIVACLAIDGSLSSDSTRQVNHMAAWNRQCEFSIVVIAIFRVVATTVINLNGSGAIWYRSSKFSIGRYHQIPLGIERRSLRQQYLVISVIVCSLSVSLRVPSGKIIIIARRNGIGELVLGNIVTVGGLEHL